MNSKPRRISKNSSIRTIKSKTVGLCKKLIKELKKLIYMQNEKHKSYNICRRVNRLGLKEIGKKQNLSYNDVKKIKQLNQLSLDNLKKIAKLRGIKVYLV